MDFSYNEDQEALAELARQIFADHVTHERLKELEASDEHVDGVLWAKLRQANLLGIALPEELGGSGLGLLEIALLLEAAGRALAPVPLLPTLVLGALPITKFGSKEQQQRWLPPIVSEGAVLSAALQEEGGHDPARPNVVAVPDGSAWRLEGEKLCVPAADRARVLLVPAATDERGVGLFALDPHGSGVTLERQLATNGEAVFRLQLAGARVESGDVLGDPREGAAKVTWIEERAQVGLAALQLGIAQEALRRTAAYTSQRKQFGRPIGSFQGVSLRAADAYIDIEALRSTLWQAVWRLEQGLPASAQVAAAKWWACRGGQRVVHSAQHLHGGIGADLDYPIHRYFLWARQVELTLGGAAPQLARIGAQLAAAGAT